MSVILLIELYGNGEGSCKWIIIRQQKLCREFTLYHTKLTLGCVADVVYSLIKKHIFVVFPKVPLFAMQTVYVTP